MREKRSALLTLENRIDSLENEITSLRNDQEGLKVKVLELEGENTELIENLLF